MTGEMWLQVHPQESWHAEVTIEGNAAALKALAAALLAAAEADSSHVHELFASDGEGYTALVRRVERPDDFREPYYHCLFDRRNFKAGGKDYCGKCGQMAPHQDRG